MNFYDTCALLNAGEDAFNENFMIAQETLEELEDIKTSGHKDDATKYKARRVARLLDQHPELFTVVFDTEEADEIVNKYSLPASPDGFIIANAYVTSQKQPICLVTDDINVKVIARSMLNMNVASTERPNYSSGYLGYKEVTLDEQAMADLYQDPKQNPFGCLTNEYLIIRQQSDGEIVDYQRWDGEQFVGLNFKPINSTYLGKVKPRNPQQRLAFDALQNPKIPIKLICGDYGTGKDFVMISNALRELEKGTVDRIVYLRNPVGLRDIEKIGYLPGTAEEKLLPYAMCIADQIGGVESLEYMINTGKICIEDQLATIRGRSYSHCIIYVSEGENLTVDNARMLISRVSEDAQLWINGDTAQIDAHIYKASNGIQSMVSNLKGNPLFSYIHFDQIERGEASKLAKLLK